MSRYIFIALSFFISMHSLSQESDLPQLSFEDYELPKAIVVDVESKSKTQLRSHIENWLDDYYTDSTLIESRFSDQTFMITAIETRLLKVKNLPCDLKYQLKISIRDYKYRFEITSLHYKYYTEYRSIANVNLIKDDKMKSDLLESNSVLSSFFNDLNNELYNSITNNQDDW